MKILDMKNNENSPGGVVSKFEMSEKDSVNFKVD